MPATNREFTLCWDCANACGNCSWSSVPPTPVSGWIATPTGAKKTSTDKSSGSFIVRQCPRFVRDAVNSGMKWSEKKNTTAKRSKK